MIYERHKQNTAVRIGIVIVNDTEKNHSVSFLGYENVKPPEGVKIYNSFGDTLYDDNRLGELRNWINAIGYIKVQTIRLSSDNLGQMRNDLSVSETNAMGQTQYMPLGISRNFDPMSFNSSILDIRTTIIINSWTTFHYSINKFSGVHMTFFPDDSQVNKLKDSFCNLYESIKDEYETFDKEKRKKFLFIS
jgi:hypothetical protein